MRYSVVGVSTISNSKTYDTSPTWKCPVCFEPCDGFSFAGAHAIQELIVLVPDFCCSLVGSLYLALIDTSVVRGHPVIGSTMLDASSSMGSLRALVRRRCGL
jgi:hypothetical protein